MPNTSEEELERLAHPEYWNERYTGTDGEQPSHEWIRTYSDLEPFFQDRLFNVRAPETDPRILHLGSGDSVGAPCQ